ncbi:putative fimbrial subunit [Yersinia enterocolitica]|nr:putative fimbrial subunit [Yersinia enterocolitica]
MLSIYILQKIKKIYPALISIFIIIYVLTPSASHADMKCTYFTSIFIIMHEVKINKSAPVNQEYEFMSLTPTLDCENVEAYDVGKTITFQIIPKNQYSSGSNTIFDSGLSGIGIKVNKRAALDKKCSLDTSFQEVNCIIPNPDASGKVRIYNNFRLSLVKLDSRHDIGEIKPPDFDLVYRIKSKNIVETVKSISSGILHQKVKITTDGCTLNARDINFDLGEQKQEYFTGIGATTRGNTQHITLTCDPNIKYSLQVDGIAEPNHPGVLKLTPDSGAASGVGVQLLANNKEIEIGKTKEMGTSATSGTNLPEKIDITARYYQTADKVTPGSANASATFTLTYQ